MIVLQLEINCRPGCLHNPPPQTGISAVKKGSNAWRSWQLVHFGIAIPAGCWRIDVTKHRTGRTVCTGAKCRSWVLVTCVWCGAYYWFWLRKGTGYSFHAFLTCIFHFCCLFSVRYRCIWAVSVNSTSAPSATSLPWLPPLPLPLPRAYSLHWIIKIKFQKWCYVLL